MVQFTRKEIAYMISLIERNTELYKKTRQMVGIKDGLSKPMSPAERQRRRRIRNKVERILIYISLAEISGICENLVQKLVDNIFKISAGSMTETMRKLNEEDWFVTKDFS